MYSNLEFEKFLIDYLKNNIEGVTVLSTYPKGNKSYPLITTSVIDIPSTYDIGENITQLRLEFRIRLWASKKEGALVLLEQTRSLLLSYGFKRLAPTEPVLDLENNKYYITESYRIRYNTLTDKFERGN